MAGILLQSVCPWIPATPVSAPLSSFCWCLCAWSRGHTVRNSAPGFSIVVCAHSQLHQAIFFPVCLAFWAVSVENSWDLCVVQAKSRSLFSDLCQICQCALTVGQTGSYQECACAWGAKAQLSGEVGEQPPFWSSTVDLWPFSAVTKVQRSESSRACSLVASSKRHHCHYWKKLCALALPSLWPQISP